MELFNQHNYKNVPYNYPGGSGATVASAGCGICAMCTALSALGIKSTVESMVGDAYASDARVNGGTSMARLGPYVAKKYNLNYETTSDENKLKSFLEKGGVAIANVGGDRTGYKGVFSDGGHYIDVLSWSGGYFKIYDVGEYAGKYSGSNSWRMEYLKRDGDFLLCSSEVLAKETENRSPNYYLFSMKSVGSIDEAVRILSEQGVITSPDYWKTAVDYVKNLDYLLIKMAEIIRA